MLVEQTQVDALAKGLWLELVPITYWRYPTLEFDSDDPSSQMMRNLPIYQQECISVKKITDSQKSVAIVEVLSQKNKTDTGFMIPYQNRRLRLLSVAATFVEVDLLSCGVNCSREWVSDQSALPYFCFVARKTDSTHMEEGNAISLREALPAVKVPICSGEADLSLNLQSAFIAAYEIAISPAAQQQMYKSVLKADLADEDVEWSESIVARRE